MHRSDPISTWLLDSKVLLPQYVQGVIECSVVNIHYVMTSDVFYNELNDPRLTLMCNLPHMKEKYLMCELLLQV